MYWENIVAYLIEQNNNILKINGGDKNGRKQNT